VKIKYSASLPSKSIVGVDGAALLSRDEEC
jgi:hypothetical protein